MYNAKAKWIFMYIFILMKNWIQNELVVPMNSNSTCRARVFLSWIKKSSISHYCIENFKKRIVTNNECGLNGICIINAAVLVHRIHIVNHWMKWTGCTTIFFLMHLFYQYVDRIDARFKIALSSIFGKLWAQDVESIYYLLVLATAH